MAQARILILAKGPFEFVRHSILRVDTRSLNYIAMKQIRSAFLFAAAILCFGPHLHATVTFSTVASFGSLANGYGPSPLVQDGANFYGTTSGGGVSGGGTVFQMTPGGTVTTLYSFTGGSDGKAPMGQLAVGSGGVLFGTTTAGGANSNGTFFSITTSGTITTLHSFNGSTEGIPTVVVKGTDGNFYATTSSGSVSIPSTVDTFLKITPVGAVTILHTFNSSTEGRSVNPSIVQGSDGAFYGSTEASGPDNNGTIFRYGLTTNPGFSILSALATLDDVPTFTTLGPDDLLYGIDGQDGQDGQLGTIFKMTNTGTRTTFHDFNNDNQNAGAGYSPKSFILGPDGNFYGETDDSTSGYGTFFRITPDGATFTTLFYFTSVTGNDAGLLTGTDGNLYTDSPTAGPANSGAIGRFTTAGAFTTLYTFSQPAQSPVGLIQAADGNLYGVTTQGGPGGAGTFFAVSPSTGTLLTLAEFNAATVGANPKYPPIQAPATGIFYGTTYTGSGSNYYGTYYHVQPGTLDFSNPSDPANTATLALDTTSSPTNNQPAALTLGAPPSGTYQPFKFGSTTLTTPPTFFSTTIFGGANNDGSIVARSTAGAYSTLYSFDSNGTDAYTPASPLVYDTSGNLYEAANNGGAGTGNDGPVGGIYKIAPSVSGAASVVTLLHSFTGTDGENPNTNNLVVGTNGLIYGTTYFGGSHHNGAIFSISNTGTYSVLHNFNNQIIIGDTETGTDGQNPSGGLVQGTDGNFYGTTIGGGITATNGSFYGTVYSMTPSGAVTILYSFTGGADGGDPVGALVQGIDGAFYGVTTVGGAYGFGGVFRLAVNQGATAQTITFPAIPDQSSTATSYTLNATATSGLPVSYLVSGPATLGGTSNNVLTFTGSGTVTVTAGQAGNSTFAPATSVTRTFAIAAAGGSTESFSAWETRYGISGTPANTTFQGDGTPLILKYLTDINPTVSMSAADRAALPVVGKDTTSNPGTTYLTLTYRKYMD
jgi:uncharacterized repeat protein (TIGR03803 family)